MSAALSYSSEQQAAFDAIRYPKGWNDPNPSMTPSPFAYDNAYISPAFKSYSTTVLAGNALPSQFSSALTQKLREPPIWSQLANPTGIMRGSGCACSQSGSGFMVPPQFPEMVTKPMKAHRQKEVFKTQQKFGTGSGNKTIIRY